MSSLWKSFTSLSPRTRIIIGGGLIAYGLAGSYLTDKAEQAFDMVPTEEDKKGLKSIIPKIHVIDKEDPRYRGHGGGSGAEQDKEMEREMERLRSAAAKGAK